jgi:hypothetical protein
MALALPIMLTKATLTEVEVALGIDLDRRSGS